MEQEHQGGIMVPLGKAKARTQVQDILQTYGSKEGNDAEILIHSKTVVEKKDFVSTGILTYALGDIIEIEIAQYNAFQLGDKVKLTAYSKSGIFVFESTVVAKEFGSIIVINPPENRKKFSDKRAHPRVVVSSGGFLHSIHDFSKGQKQSFEKPFTFSIRNVSLSGLGFTIAHELELHDKMELEVELSLGFPMSCMAQIVRIEKRPSFTFCGTRYIGLAKEKSNALRAFILKSQVELYFDQKRETKHRKAVQKQ
ncbi:PilZ domain-containing protein [Paenibacillus eucommiae]|uniref:PilZ domain-containing protein n=1 Tax=Paenibacillus eucommiae TaxID=1355755 RepID=A0ABS4IYB1_9BACL|nr:PilZ domain-containing protein [Paenibacillus eucommiae]MBP1992571.1 hypothetical protein [Paenibacillus eucommiae]